MLGLALEIVTKRTLTTQGDMTKPGIDQNFGRENEFRDEFLRGNNKDALFWDRISISREDGLS